VTDQLDCVVVGAGVIGLAIARSLALAGREVVVLEAEPRIGSHTSSRNSEVIHAGIYYPTGSLKARLCVSGREMLYRYCEEQHIAHLRVGKLIVAPNENDIGKLRIIDEQARTNGVTDLQLLNATEVVRLEPNVGGEAALLSPSTGIIDSHELMIALQAEIESNRGVVVCNSKVTTVAARDDGFRLTVAGTQSEEVACTMLVNAAGVQAQRMAEEIGIERSKVPELHLAKGHYFAYQGEPPFRHLIYPLPSGGGLGIHATNDLAGSTRFGPDVSWVDSVDYGFDESHKPGFSAAIREYFPGLDDDKLVPAYTGVRPKLSGPGAAAADFVIQGTAVHGVASLVNLFGIDSPGLTASLAIGEYVRKVLLQAHPGRKRRSF
jgi:L-2-hydroxyglutarate oxidase LhgO